MANGNREFAFTTRRFQLGEADIPIGTEQDPASAYGISATTNTHFKNDAVLPDLIPDREDLWAHYDFTIEDGTLPVVDQTGNGFALNGQYTGVSETINGLQAGNFDGSGDSLSVSFTNQAQPNTVFLVVRVDQSGGKQEFFDGANAAEQLIRVEGDGPYWNMYAGNEVDGPSGDTNAHIITGFFNTSNSTLRIDGQNVASSGVGTQALKGITLGGHSGRGNYADCALGEVLVYPQDKSSIFADVESYLSTKWGIAV